MQNLALAALTSSVSILEATVSSVMDKFHWRRRKAVIIMGLNGFFWSVIVCMGYNYLYIDYTLPNGDVGQILDISKEHEALPNRWSKATLFLAKWGIGCARKLK